MACSTRCSRARSTPRSSCSTSGWQPRSSTSRCWKRDDGRGAASFGDDQVVEEPFGEIFGIFEAVHRSANGPRIAEPLSDTGVQVVGACDDVTQRAEAGGIVVAQVA